MLDDIYIVTGGDTDVHERCARQNRGIQNGNSLLTIGVFIFLVLFVDIMFCTE